MSVFFKIFGWIFGILCIISAILQYNDPDPIVWMLIYGVAATVSIGFALQKIRFTVPLLIGILALIGFLYAFPDEFQGFDLKNGDVKNVEEGREAVGLLIIALVMFVYTVWIRFAHKGSKI